MPSYFGGEEETMFKQLLLVAALTGALSTLGLTAGPVFSEDSGEVPATVTVASPCITVPSTTIDYGTKAFATTSTGESTSTAAAFGVTNCSEAQEFVYVSGANMANADGTATWTLSNAASTTCFQNGPGTPVTLNRYKHGVTPGTSSEILLTTSNAQLGLVSPSATTSVAPKLYMPCSGSDGVGSIMSTTIFFTASF